LSHLLAHVTLHIVTNFQQSAITLPFVIQASLHNTLTSEWYSIVQLNTQR